MPPPLAAGFSCLQLSVRPRGHRAAGGRLRSASALVSADPISSRENRSHLSGTRASPFCLDTRSRPRSCPPCPCRHHTCRRNLWSNLKTREVPFMHRPRSQSVCGGLGSSTERSDAERLWARREPAENTGSALRCLPRGMPDVQSRRQQICDWCPQLRADRAQGRRPHRPPSSPGHSELGCWGVPQETGSMRNTSRNASSSWCSEA